MARRRGEDTATLTARREAVLDAWAQAPDPAALSARFGLTKKNILMLVSRARDAGDSRAVRLRGLRAPASPTLAEALARIAALESAQETLDRRIAEARRESAAAVDQAKHTIRKLDELMARIAQAARRKAAPAPPAPLAKGLCGDCGLNTAEARARAEAMRRDQGFLAALKKAHPGPVKTLAPARTPPEDSRPATFATPPGHSGQSCGLGGL